MTVYGTSPFRACGILGSRCCRFDSSRQRGFILSKKLYLLLAVNFFGLAGILILMFLSHGVTTQKPEAGKAFIILDWSQNSWQPFQERMVNNCLVTRNQSLLLHSHAVVITHRLHKNLTSYPQTRRNWQKWVWLMDESPMFALGSFQRLNFKSIRGMFNWTMTYRTTSDVYIPYGWTRRMKKPRDVPDYFSNRTKLAVAVISNCWPKNERNEYVRFLQRFAAVDVFGLCSNKICGNHVVNEYKATCDKVNDYLFYLAFENSNCKEYITEKPFSHGFGMGTVPVVMGAPKQDYSAIMPPNSFIHVDDFSGPADLAHYLTFLSKNRTEYMKYHQWRANYTTCYRFQYVTNEPLWVSLCGALNTNTASASAYKNLRNYWTERECKPHY